MKLSHCLAEDHKTLFTTWFGEHGSSVMKVARAYSLTSEECQDLAQEILLQAWRSLPKFESKANARRGFIAWHYTAMNWHRTEIVVFSQQTYGNQWRKRFEEDLVELLTRMGHPSQDTVKLVVQSLTSSEAQVLEDILMTAANRQAIKAAALSREISAPRPVRARCES